MTAKIVIASTLKPVWDPRAYEKIGKSLVDAGQYNIEIIGSGSEIPEDSAITFYNYTSSKTIISRLLLQYKIFKRILRSRPDVLIIGTHELIIPAVIFKLITGKKLIYDIRENYYYNLKYQAIYPLLIRGFLAYYIRIKERLFQSFFSLFFLAEKCYLNEINFLKKRTRKCLVLENKCAQIISNKTPDNTGKIQLLVSGTISEIYGILDVIDFYQQLPKNIYYLTIIGHCPSSKLKAQLTGISVADPSIQLEISEQPVPHNLIEAKYVPNTIGLLPYKPNKSTENKVPTKLFEYAANNIPTLISTNPSWCKFVMDHNCGICIEFTSTAINDEISNCIKLIKSIYLSDKKELMWNSYDSKIYSAINSILKN